MAASWRVQEMPKREVASDVGVAGLRRVKYEKSSKALQGVSSSSSRMGRVCLTDALRRPAP